MSSQPGNITDKIQQLSWVLRAILPDISPCSEFDLLQQLKKFPQLDFLSHELADTHALFQNHFMLFHVLYRLRDLLWEQQLAHLSISPLSIIYQPYQAAEQGISQPDPLREYYLDLSQLLETSRHDVDEMMGRFWVSMQRDEHRQAALAVLELSDPVDDMTIRKSYQKLVMLHHPDRGGDELKIQELNLAMDVLLRR